MNDDELIISGFGGSVGYEALSAVDFARAEPLAGSGSTCDAYVTSVQRRRVFVKRLKAEYRNNPLYRAAFNKEFDIGVSLSHPSLPRYVGFGGDYIVMDFVEGDTLAALMQRGDKRVKEKGFVRKLLTELADAVEYLHHRNIVHCDIKADNIIISPYNDRPATLIDLDKAYTAWLGDTSGDPAKYNCDGCADGMIDFRGIGKIAGQLGHARVAAACLGRDASVDSIRRALKGPSVRRRALGWSIGAVLLFAGAVAVWYLSGPDEPRGVQVSTVDTFPSDSVVDASDDEPVPSHLDGGDRGAEKPRTPAVSDDVDAIVRRNFDALYRRHEYLRTLAADSGTSARQLRLVITSYAADQEAAQSEIVSEVMEQFGLTNPLEAHSLLGTSREWARFMTQDMDINTLYSREIDRREVPPDSISR
ncbi:MAG: protein kinase family protein [Duncaniella sp.]|nr:protein kinase family protein [Duncaniella sp.]